MFLSETSRCGQKVDSGAIVPGQTGAGAEEKETESIKMTYSTDEARVVPAVAQGLQKAVAGINLEVTAVAFSAKHLFIVWREKKRKTRQRGNMKSTPRFKRNDLISEFRIRKSP